MTKTDQMVLIISVVSLAWVFRSAVGAVLTVVLAFAAAYTVAQGVQRIRGHGRDYGPRLGVEVRCLRG
jgi:hypothetical protein